MSVAARSIMLGIQIGKSLGGPLGDALKRGKERQWEVEDMDTQLRNRLMQEQISNPEAGLQQAPSEYVAGIGRVGLPSAVQPGQEEAASTAAQQKTPLGNSGFFIDAALAKKTKEQNFLDALDKFTKQRKVEAENPITRQRKQYVGLDARKQPITFDPENGTYEIGALPEGVTMEAKPTSRTGGGRGMTPNAQNALFSAAGAYGLNADDPAYYNAETKEYDFARLAIDTGKAKSLAKIAENKAKQAGKDNALSGEQKTYLGKLDAAGLQLEALKEQMADVAQSEPGFMDSVIATATAAPADGIFSALANKSLKYFQSDDSKKLEGRKSIIQSALTQAISGMAVSEGEARRLGFLPRPEDSFHDLLIKTGILEDYIKNQRSGIIEGPSRGGIPSAETAPSQSSPPAGGMKKTSDGSSYKRLK